MDQEVGDRLFRHLLMEGVHQGVLDTPDALLDTVFLGPHAGDIRSAVAKEHQVHGAVAQVAEHGGALQFRRFGRDGGVSLGIDLAAHEADIILLEVEEKGYPFLLEKVRPERFLLSPGPPKGQPGGQEHVGFRQPGVLQLHGDTGQHEQVVVLIQRFVRAICLVPDADGVISTLVEQEIVQECGFPFVGQDAGGETVVGGLHIAIAVIHGDDDGVVVSLHVMIPSFFTVDFPFSEEATILVRSRNFCSS